MKCDKCGYADQGTGDFAHVCSTRKGGVRLKDLIGEIDQTPEGKAAMEEGRKWVQETFYGGPSNARVQAAEGGRACNDLLGAVATTEKGNGE